MSELKTLCKKKYNGKHTINFKAEANKASFIVERVTNSTSGTLYLKGKNTLVHIVSFDNLIGSKMQQIDMFKGLEYQIDFEGQGREVQPEVEVSIVWGGYDE